MEELTFINSLEEYNTLKSDTFFNFKCLNCDKEFTKRKRRGTRGKSFKLLCGKCGAENSLIQKYGVKNAFQSEEVKAKIKETNLSRLGVDNPAKSAVVQTKIRKTLFKKLGVTHQMKNNTIREKTSKTCIAKYGKICFPQARYRYDNETFDSSWELAFYIYYKNYNFSIIRNKTKFFTYSYNGKSYKYFPDFLIQNRIFEIKGPHFFDRNGKMINPFNSTDNGRVAEKQKCIEQNNVILLKDCAKYLRYINKKYGKNFLKSFRVYSS